MTKPLFKEKVKLLGYTPPKNPEINTQVENAIEPKSIFDIYDDDVNIDDLPKLK